MLKSWQKGQQLVLVPNPHYPGNKPSFVSGAAHEWR